jgi:hypothetical protein
MAYFTRLHVGSGYAGSVLPGLLVMGFAMGMVMAPAMNTATAGVQPQDAGVAAALVSTMQQVGGSIGTAVLSTLVATSTANYLSDHGAGAAAAAATHGDVLAFTIGAGLFAFGAVMCVTLFPSKARLARLRENVATPTAHPTLEDVEAEIVAAEI